MELSLRTAPTIASQPAVDGPVQFLDRDHSILAFNERVLDWAHRRDVPLLERLRYLCIVSSNLDEFFEVRAAPHLPPSSTGTTRDRTRSSRSRRWRWPRTSWWSASTRCSTTN
jgi:polyphosphate kinase